MKTSRRDFLVGTSVLATTLVTPFAAMAAQKAPAKAAPKEEAGDDVSTNEDLMREHGVLNRILLIYDETMRRIQAKEKFDPTVLVKSAGIIKSFIEDYHEKLEEDHIFPRFEQSGKLIELTVNLRAQHAMGRRLTDLIVTTAKSGDLQTLNTSLASFNRMYRPHEAREDTVLFPALHSVVSKHEYDAMGEEFERIERKTFGGDGFDMAVAQVTELEKQFEIYDISQFTPSVPMAK
ncbi:MAG TPA: hemerythrin domain-containing protein [Candidatus Angelobacter sp.]|jgi:hemerythrin-like domain-containing protein|nr:hemerythrin domain-containing protein [Candidatus Angelobacter sp.]